jgi:apolipoprotein N-acyltransferase
LPLEHLAVRIGALAGRRRLGVAALAGAASALAMPPVNAFPVLALTLPVLVWLLDGAASGPRRIRASAWIGYAFGFGYFLAGLWWIGAAFLVDAEDYAWMMPFAVLGLPLLLALFSALGGALAGALWTQGAGRLFVLALAFGASEWLRGHVLTGFPWNEIGYALADNRVLGQAASLIGVEGLTPLAIGIFAAPAVLADGPGRRVPALALAVALLAGLTGFGAWRLAYAEAAKPGLAVRIMQPNVTQDDKFNPAAGPDILARYLALSNRASSPERQSVADVDLLIWPESAFPFLLARTPEALAEIGGLLPQGVTLLTGAARLQDDDGENRIFNSLQMLGDDGSVLASYDKMHLVPFGEFLPFQPFLESLGLRQLTRLPGGFSAGDAPRNLTLPNGLKTGPLICYEAIFSTGIVDPAERPDVLVNVTNDGWFGDTPGPRQHLAQARVRAIEQGLPMLRAANTGISAIIDPYGRVVAALPVGAEGILDGNVPAALEAPLFARRGLLVVLALYVATIVGAVVTRRRV